MRQLITLRRALGGGAAALVILLAVGAVAETASNVMTITEVYTATLVSRGVPETKTTTFQRNKGFIYCFVQIENPSGDGNEIYVAFEPATGDPAPGTKGTKLRVPPRYRYKTVARTGSQMLAGQYNCVVRARSGEVLSHTAFEVTETSASSSDSSTTQVQ